MSGRVRQAAAACVVVALILAAVTAPVTAGGDDDPYLEGRETVAIESPPLELTRPDADWVFIDVARQRAIESRTRPAPDVDAEFRNLQARIHNAPLRALVSVHVIKIVGTPPDAARLEADLRADVGRRKGAQIVEAGRVNLAGAEGAKIDWVAAVDVPLRAGQREAPGSGTSNVYYYSRLDCVRPEAGVIVTFFFETPKERHVKAKDGWLKLLKKVKWK